jgi:hypothetical protein
MIEVKTITGAEMIAAWSTKSQFLDALGDGCPSSFGSISLPMGIFAADAANLVEAEHVASALPDQSQPPS